MTDYLIASSLHKLREQAIERAINFFYTADGEGTVWDMDDIAKHGAITNWDNGRMEFHVGDMLLVSFEPVEYKLEIEYGHAILMGAQEITEHYA